MKKYQIFQICSLFTCLLFFAGCSNQPAITDQEDAPNQMIVITKSQFAHENMEIGQPQMKLFERRIRVRGIIDSPADGKAQVSTFVPGLIKNVSVNFGEKVSRGQLLCQIDSKEIITLQQDYIESAAKLQVLEKQYQGAKVLYEEKVASELDFLTAESNFKSERARYNALKAKLALINLNPAEVEKGMISQTVSIISPINGYITQHHCTNGMNVESNSFLMEIVDQNKAFVKLFVFQKDVPFLQQGQTVRFFAPSLKEVVYTGKLSMISKSTDVETNSVLCTADITGSDHAGLIIGQNVEVDIVSGSFESLCVPEEAIHALNDRNYLLIKVDEDQENLYFQKVEVQAGSVFDGWTELIDFEDQKNILLRGGYNLIID